MPTRALICTAAALTALTLALLAPPAADAGLRTVPGTAVRAAHGARVVGSFPAGAALDVAVTLQPRNPALLARLAAASSTRAPLSRAQIEALFYPTRSQVAAVRRYLAGRGLAFRAEDGLSLVFHGPAGAAERAFGVHLALYRRADGRVFHAPTGPARLPSTLAGQVAAVDGLDDAAPLRPAASPHISPASPPCAGATAFEAGDPTAYLPSELAAASAYDYQSLLDGGYDGTGESIAFVEFSNYNHADLAAFDACYGLSVPRTDVAVDGGTTDTSGALEVELDLEVAMAAAPDLDHAYVYEAPNPTGFAPVLNAIVADQASTGVHDVSISWGLCEPFVSLADASATNDALELAAVSGMSVFAASGDTGSADCGPQIPVRTIDDPAGQPYATAVGGTTLDTSGGRIETVWNNSAIGGGAGGGGVSINWPMPSWQLNAGIVDPPDSTGTPCGLPSGRYCREVPDVAFDADDNGHGYIVYCAASACAHTGWLEVGGTSAAAPLFAAITADANEYSLANGGARLGFASPFLYDRYVNDPVVLNDVTSGNNAWPGAGGYVAGSGYDLASGLGSVDAALMASDLAAYAGGAPSADATSLTGTESVRVLSYGKSVVFSGTLTDTTSALPVADQVVWVQAHDAKGTHFWHALTDGAGHWTLSKTTAISRRTTWRAFFLGAEGLHSARSSAHVLFVVPRLTGRPHLPLLSGRYVAAVGAPFVFAGASAPRMTGSVVTIQYRVAGTQRWHGTTLGDRVDRRGRFSRRVQFARTGSFWLRWHYSGSTRKPWLSASSHGRLVRVLSGRVVAFSTHRVA